MLSPLAVIVFNRPDHARAIRSLLKEQQYRDLYVIVDGPRANKVGEQKLVEDCISIFQDWPGKVEFNISDFNLGCKERVSSGLNWVFEHTDRAIILEDDLSPSSQFFQFCDEMLEAYSEAPSVMSVCGTKTYPGQAAGGEYFFSKYSNSWGWATWRRAWTQYNDDFSYLSKWQFILKLKAILGCYRAAIYWFAMYQLVILGKRSSWAYCWTLTCFLNQGLHIYPSSNLVVNKGFGEESTHTDTVEPYVPQSYGPPLSLPIIHTKLEDHSLSVADRWIEDNIYSKSLSVRLAWIKRLLLEYFS